MVVLMRVGLCRYAVVDASDCVVVHPSPPLPSPLLPSPLTQHLYNCAAVGDIPGMLCAVAHGANVNFINEAEDGRTPLIQTIHSGSLGATEFLMLNGVRPNLRDALGRGVLHHCALQGAST